MKYKKKLEILLYRNPLKSERETHEIEYKTIREIYGDLGLSLPIQDYFFLDGDDPVFDYDKIPENDKLYIKAIFTGEGGDFAEEGGKVMTGGAIALVAGVILTIVGIGTGGVLSTLGVSLAISGLSAIGHGYYLYTYDLDTPDSYNSSVTQSPSISGAKNTNRIGQKVPVLLGRHLVTPWYAAFPYTQSPNVSEPSLSPTGTILLPGGNLLDTKTQYLNMLMGNTYEQTDVLTNTIQIGEVPITEYLADGETLSSVIDFQEDSLTPTFYPQRIIEESKGIALRRGFAPDNPTPIEHTFTTAKNTKLVEFSMMFPNGIYWNNNGSYSGAGYSFRFEWKHVGASDATYKPVYPETYVGNPSGHINIGNALVRNTCRFLLKKQFSNNTSGSSEYNADRQYTFRFISLSYDDNDPNLTVTGFSRSLYLESIRSYVGTFDGVTSPETWPIFPATQEKLNITSLSLKATDQLNGVIDNLNYEMIKYQPVWNGVTSGPTGWSNAVTRNPASAFLYVLTDPYINKDPILAADLENRIDYESLETWYTFCETYNLECNNFIVNDMTVEELLKNIVSTGFASWNVIDNKYTIYIDTYNTTVTQLFTPRNSWDFQGSKTFAEVPDGLKITFTNSHLDGAIDANTLSEGGFAQETRYVYSDYTGRTDDDPLDTDLIENASVFGGMNPEQVWRLGRYMLACSELRPEVYTFKADIEHIMCTRWDRIKLQHDVPLFGLHSGRIVTPTESGGNTTGFISDEIIQYEVGNNYSVQIRENDGTINTYPIDNLGTDSYTVTFTTPISGTAILFEEDLFAFGYSNLETIDLIITKIEAQDEETATITCVEYNEAIYDAYQIGSGSIPEYTSRISKGGTSGGITVNTLPASQDEQNSKDNTNNSTASAVNYRASIVAPVGLALNTSPAFYPNVYTVSSTGVDETYVVYSNYGNGNRLYISLAESAQNPTKLNEVPTRFPKLYEFGTKILYINGEDNHLYLKNDIVTNEAGTAIYTANNLVGYAINPSNLNIFVWTYDTIYELDASDSFNVINTHSLTVIDLLITEDSEVYYIKNDGYIYLNNLSFSSESLFYDGSTTTQLQQYGVSIYFIRADLGLVYSKVIGDTDTSASSDIDIATSTTWSFAVTSAGDIIYSNTVNGFLYLATTTNAIINASMTGEPFSLSFTGDLTLGSAVVTNINNDYIDQLAVGDTLTSTGIPSGAKIISLGNGLLTLSVSATSTTTDAVLLAGGDRILLDANKVIINGTIEANKLSSSAIDSKARASNGEKISEINLDTGTRITRNSSGVVIEDFDPDRIGNELILNGTISAAEFAILSDEARAALSDGFDAENGYWLDNETGNAQINQLTAKGTMQSGDYATGDGWKIDTNGDINVKYEGVDQLSFDASTGLLSVTGTVNATSGVFNNVTINGYPAQLGSTTNITVGTGTEVEGSHYNTLNGALEYLTGFVPLYVNGGFSATITLQSTFVMEEQIIIEGVNLGWITINCYSGGNDLDVTDMVANYGSNYVVFTALNGGVGPRVLGDFNTIGTNPTGSMTLLYFMYAAESGSSLYYTGTLSDWDGVAFRADRDAIIDCSGSTSNYSYYGAHAYQGGKIIATGATFDHATSYGLRANYGADINAISCDANYSGFAGVGCFRGSRVTVDVGSFTNATEVGILCSTGGYVSARDALCTLAGTSGINSDGGYIAAYNATSWKSIGTDGTGDFVVSAGGIIVATSGQGGVSQTANTITANGIIFK